MTEQTAVFDWAYWLSITSSAATIAALIYAAYQVRQARISASASASSTIFSMIRADVERISLQTEDKAYYFAVCDFLNNLEFACALYFDGQYAGKSGSLTISLIKSMMSMVDRIPRLRECVSKAIHEETTFENIKRFSSKYKKEWTPIQPKQSVATSQDGMNR
ncbi:hypothetical protein J5N58_08180 [Rhizobium cremeum]|uniref:hypothetical protein n=1 Tax=Rhizobium cremeum TaxID=2813827 RepID=UPI001FD063D2|nr:hypothetical protein [Rhizobium cremeum]MCJ7995898.1 hypothetical protein [Rhizobium cremeum]MCJ7999653.1 hypothetical protein [Rhizobium cremeum]